MAKGKYESLNLPRLSTIPDETDSNKQERVKNAKRRILAGDLPLEILAQNLHQVADLTLMLAKGAQRQAQSFATEYAKCCHLKDSIKGVLRDIDDVLEAYRQLLVDQYEVEGVRSIKLATEDVARIQYEPYVIIEDRDSFRKWCMANGYERSLQLPWNTTNSVTKELLLGGEPEPDGCRAYMVVKVVFTRG